MSSPTQFAIDSIYNQINTSISGNFNNTNIYLVNVLNSTNYVANPVSQGTVYNKYDSIKVCNLLPSGILNSFMQQPEFGPVIIPLLDIVVKELTHVTQITNWLTRCYNSNIITLGQYNAATGYVGKFVLDSSWASGISWAEHTIGRFVDLDDCNAVRNFYLQGSGITH